MMDHKHLRNQSDESESSAYAVKRSIRADFIAAAICVLLALVVYLFVMNLTDTDYVAIDTSSLPEGYSLSVGELELTGTVAAFRNAGRIEIEGVPDGLSEGEYILPESMLILPDGLRTTEQIEIIVTVKK